MAIKASLSSQPASIIQFHKLKLVWAGLVGSGLVLLISLLVRPADPGIEFSGSQPQVVIQPVSPISISAVSAPMSSALKLAVEMKEIPIQSGSWSDWITLRDGHWYWNAPGWIEFQLENGGVWTVPDGLAFDLGNVYGHSFRVRGAPGELKLFIEH